MILWWWALTMAIGFQYVCAPFDTTVLFSNSLFCKFIALDIAWTASSIFLLPWPASGSRIMQDMYMLKVGGRRSEPRGARLTFVCGSDHFMVDFNSKLLEAMVGGQESLGEFPASSFCLCCWTPTQSALIPPNLNTTPRTPTSVDESNCNGILAFLCIYFKKTHYLHSAPSEETWQPTYKRWWIQ